MLITTIVSILIGAAGLLLAYLRYIRLSPRLEVIELFKSSTESFDEHINDLQFSYKGEVYKEIASSEFLVANRSMRSIEQDDLTTNNPLEFIINGDGIFHEIQVIKKVGDSKLDFVKKDDKTISFRLESMDRGSRQRVEILTSGTDYTIETKGKLKKANHSISRVKRIKGGFNISEIIENGLDNIKLLIRVTFLVTLGLTLLFVVLDRFSSFPEAKILAPSSYQAQYNQFVLIDSLQSDTTIRSLAILAENKNDNLDTLNLNRETGTWSMSWNWDDDPQAQRIADSLEESGYAVYYENKSLSDCLKYDEYRLSKSQPAGGYRIIHKKYSWIYFKKILNEAFLISVSFGGLILIIGLVSSLKSFRMAFRFRNYLTEEEKEEIEKSFLKYSLTGLLFKILVK